MNIDLIHDLLLHLYLDQRQRVEDVLAQIASRPMLLAALDRQVEQMAQTLAVRRLDLSADEALRHARRSLIVSLVLESSGVSLHITEQPTRVSTPSSALPIERRHPAQSDTTAPVGANAESRACTATTTATFRQECDSAVTRRAEIRQLLDELGPDAQRRVDSMLEQIEDRPVLRAAVDRRVQQMAVSYADLHPDSSLEEARIAGRRGFVLALLLEGGGAFTPDGHWREEPNDEDDAPDDEI